MLSRTFLILLLSVSSAGVAHAKQVTPIETVRVDGVLNVAGIGDHDCNGTWALFSPIDTAGVYAVAISDGPGIKFMWNRSRNILACSIRDWDRAAGLSSPIDFYSIRGIGSSSDPASFAKVDVLTGQQRQIAAFVPDDRCSDNSGYVEVTLYRITP